MNLFTMSRGLLALATIFLMVPQSLLCADGPTDNQPDQVRLVPPPGIELSREVRMTVATNMFYSEDEVKAAQELLKVGAERLEKLAAGASELELLGATLHWYDCPDWTNNLRAVPTVAYSGEKDRQKQAADVMQAAFTARGMKLPHVIGPDTEHKIHADSKIEIEQFLSNALKAGKPHVPRRVDLTTYMLRYHELGWLSIEGLEEHWQFK